MKLRNAILLLLSLTLVCSGCATGTFKTKPDTTAVVQNQVAQDPLSPPRAQESQSTPAVQATTFGLLSHSATEDDSVKTSRRVPQRGGTEPNTKTILSVGYQKDDSDLASGGEKIDFGSMEDAQSHSDSSQSVCCSDSDAELSPPPALPFENEFEPTVWTGVTIDQVRAMAYEYHPVTARAQAKLDALRARYLQKGLPNNPRIGLNADDVNEGGNAGRWGVQFGRKVVRGGKRESDQAIVCAEIEIATEELKLVQQRLDTDIALRFYDCMVAQEQIAMAERMQALASRATDLSRKLYAAQEVTRSSVLQAELELEKATVTTKRLANRHLWSKQQLAALVGQEELPTLNVGGSIDDVSLEQDFEATYDRLLKHSPELSVLFADIERSRRVASRERLETTTDLTWQTIVQYDTVEDRLIGGFQMTWQIPVFNQNQGAIQEAEHNVAAGQHAADVKALNIRQRLSKEWQQYLDAQLQVDAFRDSILPKSQQALEILMKGYEVGETELLEVLMAQRTFFQTQVTYLENVRLLSRQNARIQGMLLGESLSQ